nr:MAG TPA: hypothetical protein [Inoviridae sp.]
MNKFRIFLYYSGLVDIKAREGHDAVEGVSMEFLFYGEHGEQVEPTVSADGISGTRRGKSFLKSDKVNKVSYVPGIYDGTFEMSVGADGKPVLKLVDVDFVSPAVISMMKDNAPSSGKGDK